MYSLERFEITEDMIDNNVKMGNIEVLAWMAKHGAKFTKRNVIASIQGTQFEAMVYLLKQRCAMSIGYPCGNPFCYKYAHEHSYLWNSSADLALDDAELLRYMVQCGQVALDAELYQKAKE
jgi:hypothetical protein